MTVYDLNRDQLIELKQRYLADAAGRDLSYGELADADSLVTDEEIYNYYAGTEFVVDDFFSGEDENEDIPRFIIVNKDGQVLHKTAYNSYEWDVYVATLFNEYEAQEAFAAAKKQGFTHCRVVSALA